MIENTNYSVRLEVSRIHDHQAILQSEKLSPYIQVSGTINELRYI